MTHDRLLHRDGRFSVATNQHVRPASTASDSIMPLYGVLDMLGTRPVEDRPVSAGRDFHKTYRQYPNLITAALFLAIQMDNISAPCQGKVSPDFSVSADSSIRCPASSAGRFRLRHQLFTRTKNHRARRTHFYSQTDRLYGTFHTFLVAQLRPYSAPSGLL